MIPVARPSLGEEEAAAAREAILSGWVAQGPQVAAFESEFADFVGAPHACAVSSCTAALHMALLALGVGPGDEVVTVSHSFIATANAVRYVGARPAFVDIDPATYNVDPDLLEAAITPRTRAILAVHQMGLPCDVAAVLRIAAEHGLPVVEDAACAIGSAVRLSGGGPWEPIGRPHGDVACFSFHPRKLVTTGEGGMLTTRDPALDRRFRLLRQHGMSVSDRERHSARSVAFEEYETVGFNFRMSDVQAAVGRVQLRRLPAMLARRAELAARYAAALRDVPGLSPPCCAPARARPNHQSYPVRVAAPPFPLGRDALMQALLDRGVSTRRGIMNAHQEPACADLAPFPPLPHSEAARDGVVLLPLYADMTDDEQSTVVGALRALSSARAGRRRYL